MAKTSESQDKYLELLDVFRDFTETGRVKNQYTEKLSSKLAYHSASLAAASQQATKTMKNAVYLATQKTTNQIKNATIDLTKDQAKTSYATIAAQNKNTAWTTIRPKKKQNTKKPNSYYQTCYQTVQEVRSPPD
jgi:hypothetical protein